MTRVLVKMGLYSSTFKWTSLLRGIKSFVLFLVSGARKAVLPVHSVSNNNKPSTKPCR